MASAIITLQFSFKKKNRHLALQAHNVKQHGVNNDPIENDGRKKKKKTKKTTENDCSPENSP